MHSLRPKILNIQTLSFLIFQKKYYQDGRRREYDDKVASGAGVACHGRKAWVVATGDGESVWSE
jgi:hypothetical protein